MNLSEQDKNRFETVRKRAEEMGVNFSGVESADALDCYKDTIERHKETINNLAGVSHGNQLYLLLPYTSRYTGRQ